MSDYLTGYQRGIVNEGAIARAGKQTMTANPYKQNSQMHAYHLWAAGWEDAKQFNKWE
tara:strand:- start:5 stop:178 length:174 start_codon:yes stop_codon:yes gene_type:complete